MKKPENLSTVPLPWGQNAELEFTSPAVALMLVPLAEGESPHAEASPEVQLEVKESGKLTRVTATPAVERFNLWRSVPRVWLHLPRDVHARISTEAGALMAAGFAGCELELSASMGVIELRDVHGKLTLRASAGTIRGEKVGGVLDVETEAGAIKLDVDTLEAGTHRVRSSMGSVKVHLAAGMDVRLESQTTLGSVRTRYPSRPGATVVLRLETELGSVRVRESNSGRSEERGEAWHEHGLHEHDLHEHWMNGPWMHGRGRHAGRRHGRHGHETAPAAEAAARGATAEGADEKLRRILKLMRMRGGRWMQGREMHEPEMHGRGRHGRHGHETAPAAAEAPARGATAGVADEELRRILTLVQEQKLTAAQAELLLRAMDQR